MSGNTNAIEIQILEYLTHKFAQLFPELHGLSAPKIKLTPYQGYLNYTYELEFSASQSWIAKVKRRSTQDAKTYTKLDWSNFHKECWAIDSAWQYNLRVSKVLPNVAYFAEGDFEYACLLQSKLPGIMVSNSAIGRRDLWLRLLPQLGAQIRTVHSIPCRGYGAEFNSDNLCFTKSWAQCLDAEGERYGLSDILNRPIMSGGRKQVYFDMVSWLKGLGSRVVPRLVHADLNDTNILFDPSTFQISGVVDWERAIAAPAPEWELMEIWSERLVRGHHYDLDRIREFLLGKQAMPELEAFLSGYGITYADYLAKHHKFTKALLVIKTLPFLNWWYGTANASDPEWEAAAVCGEHVVRICL